MPSLRALRSSLSVLALTTFSACAPGEVSGPQGPELMLEETSDLDAGANDCAPTLASIQSTIFTPLCASAGCHVGTRAAAALDLTRTDLERYLPSLSASSCSGRKLLVPGDPDASLLMGKIDGHLPAGCGDPMPPTGVMLSNAQLACVRTWIAALPAVDAGATSDGGTSDAAVCGSGLTACNAACVDTATDPNNCQGCGAKCATGQLCAPTGCSSAGCGKLTQCGGACVDTSTSALNCGACGVVCGGGKSCVMGSCVCAGGPVSFSAVAPILADNCTNNGCHVGTMPKEGLNLSASKAYAELVNVKATQCNDGRLLVPSNGMGASYLMQKLLGQNMCSGSKMPKADTTLPAADLALIQAWICNGAQP
jgi:hypothetical protein